MGDSAKGSTRVQADNIHSISLIHQASHIVTEDQAGQTGPDFHKSSLARPDSPDNPARAPGWYSAQSAPWPALAPRSGWQT